MCTRWRLLGWIFIAVLFASAVTARPLVAANVNVFDRTLTYYLTLSQTAAFGLRDEYDTLRGLNQAVTTALLEGDYSPTDNLKVYGMLSMTGDLAYAINRDNDTWNRRQFNKSSDDLAYDKEYWRILREFHLTWKTDKSMLRVGKQTVLWGELILFRILDQINPTDGYRGVTDLEVETTILPTWLVRADHAFSYSSAMLSNINLQVVYNPNVDNNIYTRGPSPGNASGGVWAPYSATSTPLGVAQLGTAQYNIAKPDEWTDGRIGLRLQGLIGETLTSVNFIYGRDNNMLVSPAGAYLTNKNGQLLVHGIANAFFPIRKMIGGMFATELSSIPRIGGITSPMLRVEWSHMWDSKFVRALPTGPVLETHDDTRLGVGLEVGVPIRWLNPDQLVRFQAVGLAKMISGIDEGYRNVRISTEGAVQKYNYNSALVVSSSFWANRITPAMTWSQDWTNDANIFRVAVSYTPSSALTYSVGATFFSGSKTGQGFEAYDHKDNISFKIQYKLW